MGQVKQGCTWVPKQAPNFRLRNSHPDWEMHPNWTAALKHLDSYNLWICEVVMPIAFQWIEEHKEEVYSEIEPANVDDVGVVIAHAFAIVQKTPAYQRGLETFGKFENAITDNKLDLNRTNPVWQDMAKHFAGCADAIASKFGGVLRNTTRSTTD